MKQKIINDPLYGFISISDDLIQQLIDHRYYQRLRRIRQLGMTQLVYPGATHTRFQHALGAMYLMQQSIALLRSKGHNITQEEEQAVSLAILLHDIGHGPFSHALEDSIVKNIHHEELSSIFMSRLNEVYSGKLEMAIAIFKGEYSKNYLHQLVSSQLDMDRMDYLNRDSFYCGVNEGVVSHDRIIKMLDICNNDLCIDIKGIYSIEKFIVARRLMYWQVYLHKTVVSAECLLINILKRARSLARNGMDLFATPSLKLLLSNDYDIQSFLNDESLLDAFAKLDDSDIATAVKVWADSEDKILSDLCSRMSQRKLFKIILQSKPFDKKTVDEYSDKIISHFKINPEDLGYYLLNGKLVNNAYTLGKDKINILYKDGTVKDIFNASESFSLGSLSNAVEKYYLCFPKEVA